jgi:hypothetical protein
MDVFMSGFPERLAEALIKSLSQNDLEKFYTYIKYLQVALATLYIPTVWFICSAIKYTVKRRKILLRKWGKLKVFLANLSIFIFVGIPIFSTIKAMSNLNSTAILIYNSLSNRVLSLDQFKIIQFVIGLAQVILFSLFMSRKIEPSKK